MAVRDDNATINGTAATQTQQIQQPQPEAQMGAPTQAPRPEMGAPRAGVIGVRELLAQNPTFTTMSAEATAYVEKLENFFINHQTVAFRNIKIVKLSSPNGVIIAEYQDRACPIMFHEVLQNVVPVDMPDTVVLREALINYKKYHKAGGKFKTVSPVVVHASDYYKAEVMANWLCTVLTDITAEAPITASIMKGEPLLLSINHAEVMSFVERVSPHGIPARHDIGFKLSLAPKGQNYQARQEIFSSYRSDVEDLAAVTGYVEIITGPMDPMTRQAKYTPVVHITDIVTRIQDIRMFIMLLSVASEVFIRTGLWRQQFTRFGKDEPNIGALLMDPSTKNTMFVGSQAELDAFCVTYLTNPILVVDIADGRARVPDTELFTIGDAEALDALISKYAAVFSNINTASVLPQGVNPATQFSFENTGIAPIGGKLMDTREIDYLRIVTNRKQDRDTASILLTRPQGAKPSDRFLLQQKFYPEAVALYNNNVMLVDFRMIAAIQAEMAKNVTLDQRSWAPGMANIDVSNAVLASAQYMGQGAGFTFGGPQGINAFTTIAPGFYI